MAREGPIGGASALKEDSTVSKLDRYDVSYTPSEMRTGAARA